LGIGISASVAVPRRVEGKAGALACHNIVVPLHLQCCRSNFNQIAEAPDYYTVRNGDTREGFIKI
jgi:hypothetical protein